MTLNSSLWVQGAGLTAANLHIPLLLECSPGATHKPTQGHRDRVFHCYSLILTKDKAPVTTLIVWNITTHASSPTSLTCTVSILRLLAMLLFLCFSTTALTHNTSTRGGGRAARSPDTSAAQLQLGSMKSAQAHTMMGHVVIKCANFEMTQQTKLVQLISVGTA
jgi:hypothetical protein